MYSLCYIKEHIFCIFFIDETSKIWYYCRDEKIVEKWEKPRQEIMKIWGGNIV